MKHYHRVLTIAGSDSGGGAGLQADIKTITMLRCYAMTAVTALTAQNTQGVQGVLPVPTEFIKQQIHSIDDDIGIDAIKIGMLANCDIINAVYDAIAPLMRVPIVLDPVMVATSGDLLVDMDSLKALKRLFDRATLITPNMREASFLLDTEVSTHQDMEQAAKALCEGDLAAALVKGGHLNSDTSPDCLYIKATNEIHWFDAPRIITGNTHGTGCTLSSAIAAYLARGEQLTGAIAKAKTYLSKALFYGCEYLIGQGYGPIQHFYALVEEKNASV